jgi:tetratricopeptide (TPR) repeat protein
MQGWIVFVLSLAATSAQQSAPAPAAGEFERTFRAAEALMKSGKVAEAAKTFEQAVRLRPDFAEAYFALGVSYTQLGRSKEASSAFQSYVKLEPDSADGHAALGVLLLTDGRVAAAQPELETALRLDPLQSEAAKALALVYNIEGAPAKAVPLLRALVKSGEADDEARTILARSLYSSGDVAGASAMLDPMLAVDKDHSVETYILAAVAAREAHDLQKAMRICEQGVRAHPNAERIEALYVSMPKEPLVDRINQRLERIRQNPKDVGEMIAVGRAMSAAGKGKRGPAVERGEALLALAVQLDKENSSAWYQYGRCLLTQLKLDDARAAFTKALSFVREDELRTLILERMGLCESRSEHFEAAYRFFRESLDLNRKLESHISESAFDYYWFLVMRDREAEATELLEEILHWEPLFTPALLERAKTFVRLERPEKAIEDSILVTRNAEDPELQRSAHFLLVKIYRMLGRNAEAQTHADWIQSHH